MNKDFTATGLDSAAWTEVAAFYGHNDAERAAHQSALQERLRKADKKAYEIGGHFPTTTECVPEGIIS